MNWLLLAEETTDLSALLKLGGFGSILFVLGIGVKYLHEYHRKWKDGRKKDELDAWELQLKKDKEEHEKQLKEFELEKMRSRSKLELSIAEDDAIEAQFQRIIESQSKFITHLQTKRDERVTTLEKKMEEVQGKLNNCVEEHARASERNDHLTTAIKKVEEELRLFKEKYYFLKQEKKKKGKPTSESDSGLMDPSELNNDPNPEK